MNFLSEVINIVNENDIADARSGLKKLRNEIGKHQNAAKDYIEANYVDFNDMVVENSQLLEQADKLSIEVDGLYEKINIETKEDIKGVANDLQSYLNEMEELRIGLRVNKRLIRIDNLFRQLELTQELNQITEVHTVLSELKECIFNHEDHDLFKQLDCYTNLKNRWQIEKEGFSTLLSAMFDTKFQTEERSFQTSKCVLLKISTDAQLQQIFYLLLQTSFNVQRLFTFLMANVFEPILTRPVSFETKTVKDGQKSMEFNTIEVSFSTKQIGSGERSLRPNYKHVFSHLTKVFNILKPINIILPNKKRFFQHMADKISGEFFDLLIGECLEHSIPERIDDLCNSDLTKDIKDFDEFLKSVNFHSESTSNKAIEFIEKIDVIFKKRFCLDIINRAVQIMQQDLHEMQIIEESNADGNFPRCMVSRSTFDLINLMEQVLKESENMTAKSVDAYVLADIKARLRQTIPLILHQYPTEILNTHGKLLQTIPQPSALFHNNCTYLAWWFSRCDIDEANADQPGSFSSDAINNELQEYGSKQFATQISNQRTQIMEILKDLGMLLFATLIGLLFATQIADSPFIFYCFAQYQI